MGARLGHLLFGTFLALGAVLRLAAVAHPGLHAPGAALADVRHVAGLVLGSVVFALLVRWQVWTWLAALAAAPTLLDVRVVAAESPPGGRYLVLVVLSALVVAAAWRGWDDVTRWVWGGIGVVVLAAALTVRSPGPHLRHNVVAAGLAHSLWWPLPLLGAVVALAAAVGVGRADRSALRGPCAALALGPLAALAVGPTAQLSWHDMPMLVVWWPAAGALGLTALLRGRRGPAVDTSAQADEIDRVDRAALAAFGDRYGRPDLAPVAVVIAAYNEAEGLPEVLAGLPSEVCGLPAEVLVVDDGSADGTAAVVEAHASGAGPTVRVVACPVNRGQGAALRLGYRVAREHGADYVITTDADGQYDVADFPTVLAPLLADRADFVTGSRILGAQHTHDRVRRVGVHVFAWIASGLTGLRLTDTSFGLRAMRASATERVTLRQPQYQSSELLLGMISHGYRVLEVPGTMHLRSAGASKKGRNLVYGSRYARVVLGTWWREGGPRPVVEPGLRRRQPHLVGPADRGSRSDPTTGPAGRVGADAG